jgi:hypothetical protein
MNTRLSSRQTAVGREKGPRIRGPGSGDRGQEEEVGSLEREAMARKSDSSFIIHHSSISFGEDFGHKAITHQNPLPPPSGDTG